MEAQFEKLHQLIQSQELSQIHLVDEVLSRLYAMFEVHAPDPDQMLASSITEVNELTPEEWSVLATAGVERILSEEIRVVTTEIIKGMQELYARNEYEQGKKILLKEIIKIGDAVQRFRS